MKESDKEFSIVEAEKKKAFNTSIKASSASSATTGIGDSFITAFAVDALKASALQVGILSSLTSLISPIAQLFGSRLMLKQKRKNIVLKYVFLQVLLWLPLVILPLLAFFGILSPYLMIFLIVIYSLIYIAEGLHFPSWFSWLGDLIPEKERGKYFSKKNIITGVVGLVAALIGAVILKVFRANSFVEIGFAVIFFIAFLFKIVTYRYLRRQYEPKLEIDGNHYFSFFDFIKRYDNFGKFAVYQAVFNFAIMIASPFFAVYMLKVLQLDRNYILFTLITISPTIFYLLFSNLAGKFSDRYGNLKLIYLANFLFVLSPMPWIFFTNPLLLILLPGIISGLANAFFVISFTNFTYDSVSPEKRGICTAHLNILVGIGGFVGALLGGFMLKYINFSISTFFIVFALAAFARLVTGLIFLPQIKEVRKVERMPSVHISLLHPLKTLHSEMSWIRSFLK